VPAQALKPRCRVQLVDVPVAAAAGAGFDQAAGAGAFIVDVGGGTTQAAILAGGHIVRARSVRRAGNAMDDAIIRAIRKEHELLIGRSAARSLKMTLGLADEADAEAEVLGVDAARRVPRAERISGRLIAQAIAPTVAAITGVVEEMLSDLPPNLAAEIFAARSGSRVVVPCYQGLPTGSKPPPTFPW